MCGLCGVLDRSGNPVDPALVAAMSAALRHRGPDGSGGKVDGALGLGHRRLSIIDLEGGAQPMSDPSGRYRVVFNGEIYNYVELRQDLVRLGHRFATASDTEVLLHAYLQWGRACLDRLNGMFAFAVADRLDQRLFLARDHLGIKPLYYAELGSQFVFASEIKALLSHPLCRAEVDADALAQLFTFRCVPSPRTAFRGILKLPPGHCMEVGRGGIRVERYWHTLPSERAGADERELVARYQSLLEDAVRLQLRSDVPLGLFLSSGVDSGGLLALMAQHLQRPPACFTLGFTGGGKTDEVADARAMAARFGATQHESEIGPQDYRRYYERYLEDVEEPVGHEAAPAFFFLARLTARHVKVALTGQGADEPWAGYRRHLGVRLSHAYARLPQFVTASVAALVDRTPLPLASVRRAVRALHEPDLLNRFVGIYSFFSEDMKRELYRGAMRDVERLRGTQVLASLQGDVRHLDPLAQMLYIDTRLTLPDDLLMVADKTSMANSIEVRVPYLDRRLVEFVESLPTSLKLKGVTGKYLHKKALLKWLPRDVVYRRKKGFANPLGAWFRGPLRDLVEDVLLSKGAGLSTYFDQEYVRRLVEAHRAGTKDYTRHVNLLLAFELWHRRFVS